MRVWRHQILDSSVAEFILSNAEGLPRNDMSRLKTVTWSVRHPSGQLQLLDRGSEVARSDTEVQNVDSTVAVGVAEGQGQLRNG